MGLRREGWALGKAVGVCEKRGEARTHAATTINGLTDFSSCLFFDINQLMLLQKSLREQVLSFVRFKAFYTLFQECY